MKPKLILCLALVLSGSLFCCAQDPKNTDMGGNEIAKFYHLDIEKTSHEDRVKLAHDFPKLTPKNQYLVLAFLWPQARCPEFTNALLPLAKLPKTPEQYNDDNLCDYIFIRLLDLRPETVRPTILEDLRRPNPLFSLCVLQALPDKELPELDDILLANLNNRRADMDKIPPLIERYATARIMPQVIAFYGSSETGWMCSLQTAILRYWVKHDRPAALQAIEKAVNFRESTGCFKTVLGETLHDSFDADAEKLVRKFINDSDPEVAADAKNLLAQHGSKPQQP
jgi:hypothetical protein